VPPLRFFFRFLVAGDRAVVLNGVGQDQGDFGTSLGDPDLHPQVGDF
jgi:hypothetical protein